MGTTSSAHQYSVNDFELVITAAKHLEQILTENFSATGNGLGEKIISARMRFSPDTPLPAPLCEKLKMINRERNKLVHDVQCNAINNRQMFIIAYENCVEQLTKLSAQNVQSSSSNCVIS